MTRYHLEVAAFERESPKAEIIKTADLIAENSWFSWVHCRKRLRALPKDRRKAAMKLLRVAQKQRRYGMDDGEKWFFDYLDRKIDYMQCFTAPVNPAAYAVRWMPIFLNGEKIGHTLGAKRMRGGKIAVFYQSKVAKPLALQRIEAQRISTGCAFLDSEGYRFNRSHFHVQVKT